MSEHKNSYDEKHESYRERFVRWQQITIKQLSFTNNLFLGLTVGFLGFYIDQTGLSFSNICWLFVLQAATLLALVLSFTTGAALVTTRLKNFRETAQLVKNRKKKIEMENRKDSAAGTEQIKSLITSMKLSTDRLGKRTWTLLSWQIWSFVAGTILGIIYFIAINNNGA